MVFGREIVLPIQAVISAPDDSDSEQSFSDPEDYICNLKKKLQENHEIARKCLKQAANYQKRHYDLKAKKRSFRTGQAVWVYEPARKVGICTKLTSPWKGPYIVEKKIDDVTYRVKRSMRQPSRIYHIDKLALYLGRNVPSWATRFMNRHVEHCVRNTGNF